MMTNFHFWGIFIFSGIFLSVISHKLLYYVSAWIIAFIQTHFCIIHYICYLFNIYKTIQKFGISHFFVVERS